MRKLAGITFLFMTVLFSSCTKEELGNTMSQQTGKLVLNDLEVSASVSDQLSRATLDTNLPSGDKFVITVKSEASSFEQTLEEGVFECILPVGTYTVKAVYGEDVVSLDTPYFYGETSVEIKEGATAPVSITATLQSAIIRPVMDEALLAQYTDYSLSVSDANNTMTTVANNTDLFVPAGKDYTLWLMGENQLGNQANTSWSLNQLSAKTRYIVSCNADLPSFTFPEQAETNAWSKFIYVTPMTAENMSSHPEMADQVIANIVYEASADNGATWLPATYDAAKGKWVIKDLQPSTTYTLRSRFGGVISTNTQTLTTENAQDVPNGGMEDWTSTPLHNANVAWDADVNCDYCTGWVTRNEKTTDGASNANGTNNYATKWRWCSGTIQSSNGNNGYAAELSTLAFYNQRVTSSTIGLFGSQDKVWDRVLENHSQYVAYLLLGSYDLSTDTYTLGIDHSARPVSISFDYEYAPVDGDQCIAYAKLYDETGREIATTEDFHSGAANYTTQTLNFIYTDLACSADKIGVFFQSGTDLDINKMTHERGNEGTPYNDDRIVGSVLKIDNVKLNYDYE